MVDHVHFTSFAVIYLMLFFQFKHFICNMIFPYNIPREEPKPFFNYIGLRHSFLHGVGTTICIVLALPSMIEFALIAGFFDFIAHHIIDTCDRKIQEIGSSKLAPLHFRVDVDQFFHQLTYIAILVAGKWWNLLVYAELTIV